MGILFEQNYNAQAEYAREDSIPENIPTVQHVQIDFGLKHRSLTYGGAQKSENHRAAHDHCIFAYSREQFGRDMEACGYSPLISIL